MIGFNCSVDLYAIDGPFDFLDTQCPPAQTLCCLCENTVNLCTCTAMSSSSSNVPKHGHRQLPIPNKGKGTKDKQKDKKKGTPAEAGESGPLPPKGSRKGRSESRPESVKDSSRQRSDSARPPQGSNRLGSWKAQKELYQKTRRMDAPREEVMRLVMEMTTRFAPPATSLTETAVAPPVESEAESREQPLGTDATGSLSSTGMEVASEPENAVWCRNKHGCVCVMDMIWKWI